MVARQIASRISTSPLFSIGRVHQAPRERRAHRRSSPSRAGPDSEPGEPKPSGWGLTLVDRAPLLWRGRAVLCRLREWREGAE
jgi:hypothetical protein